MAGQEATTVQYSNILGQEVTDDYADNPKDCKGKMCNSNWRKLVKLTFYHYM